MPTIQLLDSLPVVAIFVLFVIISLLCYEGGFRVGVGGRSGRRASRKVPPA